MSDYKYCWGYEKDDMCNFEDTIKQCLKEADGWLDDVTKEQAKDLEKRVNAVIAQWLEETGNKPHFGAIGNIRRYEIETGRDATYDDIPF